MYKLNFKKRAWIVKQILKGKAVNKVAQAHVQHYNENRLHMSLHYKTPKEVWKELKNV